MPILDVELIGPVPDDVRRGLAQRIADTAGDALESRAGGTWVKLGFVESDHYAENGGMPGSIHPVIVSVLQAEPPTGGELVDCIEKLTHAIAEACGRRPENVHIVFEPPGAGRVAFGGRLRTR